MRARRYETGSDGKFASRWRAKSPDALCAVLPTLVPVSGKPIPRSELLLEVRIAHIFPAHGAGMTILRRSGSRNNPRLFSLDRLPKAICPPSIAQRALLSWRCPQYSVPGSARADRQHVACSTMPHRAVRQAEMLCRVTWHRKSAPLMAAISHAESQAVMWSYPRATSVTSSPST